MKNHLTQNGQILAEGVDKEIEKTQTEFHEQVSKFSPEELKVAMSNVGVNLFCGACMMLFFTGCCLIEHDCDKQP